MNRKGIIIASTIGVSILLLWLTRQIPYCGWDFHNSLWGPVNMLIHHQTPYTFSAPYGPYPGVWMPPTLGLAFFIGYISCDIASKVWLLIEIAGFIWVIWMIADYKMPPRWVFTVCLLTYFLFPPFWIHVRLGQFSMLFVIIMMVIVYVPRADSFIPLLLVLGLTKPQLAILIYPSLLVSVWRMNGFRKAAELVLSTGIATILLMTPLFLYYPGWLKDFLFVTIDNLGTGWDLPTLFVQLPVHIGIAGYGIWAFVFLITLVTSIWLWSCKDSKTGLIASLAITPMVTPYASSWDFLLLLPAFFWLIVKLRSRAARAILLLSMLAVFVTQITLRWHQNVRDGSQWWIPPVLLLVYLLALAIEHSSSIRRLFISQRLAS
jgi:hypothetical protein